MVKKDILVDGIVVGSYDFTGDMKKDIEAAEAYLKAKGIHKEVSKSDAIFRQANSFAEVANHLYQTGLKKSPYKGAYISPFIVNATFSIELYLKTIHNFYSNNIKGHHLASLFKGMPKKGKEFVNSAAADVKSHFILEQGVNFPKCLESLSKSFVQWRYIYEHNEIGVELQSVRYAMHVCFEACSRVRGSEAKHNNTP